MSLFSNLKTSKTITFSGVDGAGKTTILTEIKNLIEKKYNKKAVVIRHRPSVLPILSSIKYGRKKAEAKTMEVLPRSGTNRSKVSSLIRFLYYLIDYVFGQWVVFFKYYLKGYIVIYDRYYFDFICDPKRSNINLDNKFIKYFYKFVFKPDINIFLYASPDIILSRKQELEKPAILDLTNQYKELFDNFENSKYEQYICIENIEKENTMIIIEELLKKAFND